MSETTNASVGLLATLRQTVARRYFLAMAVLLLAIVLVGFAPTFHLKMFFGTPALPLYLHVHGALLIAWFALFVAQTILVASGRSAVHRRLGLASVALVAALLPASIMTNLLSIARLSALAPDATASIEGGIFAVTLNFVLLAMFVAFYSIAIFVRRRQDWHKRLMLLASLSLVAPAVDRLGRVVLSIDPVTSPFIAIVTTTLMLSLIAHDVLVRGRPHAVSLFGILAFLAAMRLGTVFAQSDTGRSLVLTLTGMS